MNYPQLINGYLSDAINSVLQNPRPFLSEPDKHFSRVRKLNLESLIRFILSMSGGNLSTELLEFFSFNQKALPSKSALCQRRNQLDYHAFIQIFQRFVMSIPHSKLFHGYRLLAVDGSDIPIPHNPNDPETYFRNKNAQKGYNLLYLNAMYDVLNRTYVDAITRPARKSSECRDLCTMVERSSITDKVIITADRGYENFNTFAHIINKKWDFVIRIKDVNSASFASTLSLPDTETFDVDYSILISRTRGLGRSKEPHKYKFLHDKRTEFDFIPLGSDDTFPFNFRILRIPISKGKFEVIITTLSRDEFPPHLIKEIYFMRWGIETSFRFLKYTLGLDCLHSKKVANIHQEIFAKLIMYNFCESITSHVIIEQKSTNTHLYKVNFTMAVFVCLKYFRTKMKESPPEALIPKYIEPIRKGRSFPRHVRRKGVTSFSYRLS